MKNGYTDFKQLLLNLYDGIVREAVLFWGAVALSITAWRPEWVDNDAKKAAVVGITLFLQRAFTTSKRNANMMADVAAYNGALEHQAVTQASRIIGLETRTQSPHPAKAA